MFLNKNYCTFFKSITQSPIKYLLTPSESRSKIDGPLDNNKKSKNKEKDCCKQCTKGEPCCTEESIDLLSYKEISEETLEHNIPELETYFYEDPEPALLETEFVNFHDLYSKIRFIRNKDDLDIIIRDLNELEIMGDDPLKYWDNNKLLAKLDIINLEYKIRTAEIEASNLDLKDFKMHIDELLKLKVIRHSKSEHRSSAFIVRNHNEITRGKSRMVINYKRLNDNTRTDGYNIPNKSQLINRIQGAKYFSKFDCKSGFWQIKMHPDSIPWTAFSCPEGFYEWIVMPFGLKNAPSIFQRKMDEIFLKHKFVLVYIDDILVFSKTLEEHLGHLKLVFSEFIKHGIIISKKKTELCKTYINFLGVNIGEGKIKLQPHISKKILDMPDKLETLKELQTFLGLLNYARPFIKDLGKIAGPLFSKTGKNGQRHFNQEDIRLVQKLKELVNDLPDLSLPLDTDYIIIESDGSFEGWGAVLKAKPHKYSEAKEEKICGYSSGKYKERGNMSSIDCELLAVIYALNSFKLSILGKPEIELRTDCEAIVKFYAKSSDKRTSKRRWLNFVDIIEGNGYNINFVHIKGKNNSFADMLSRILKEKDRNKLNIDTSLVNIDDIEGIPHRQQYFIQAELQSKNINVLIDTGSFTNFINRDLIRDLPRYKLKRPICYENFVEKEFTITEYVKVTLVYTDVNNYKHVQKLVLHVNPKGDSSQLIILGTSFLNYVEPFKITTDYIEFHIKASAFSREKIRILRVGEWVSFSNEISETRNMFQDKGKGKVYEERSERAVARNTITQNPQIMFGKERLTLYPNSNISFRTMQHIAITPEQRCLLDNLWIAFNKKDQAYFIACLNAASEYFNSLNSTNRFAYYVVYKGKTPGVYNTWPEVVNAIKGHKNPLYKGFHELSEALDSARGYFGPNIYLSRGVRLAEQAPSVRIARDTTQKIIFCDHCETMTTQFKRLNQKKQKLEKEYIHLERKCEDLIRELGRLKEENSSKTMEDMLQVKKLTKEATIPQRISRMTAKYELYSAQELRILPRTSTLITTDLAIVLPRNTYGIIAQHPNASWKKDVEIQAEAINKDSQRPLKVLLINNSEEEFIMNKKERLAQLILEADYTPNVAEVINIDSSRSSSSTSSSNLHQNLTKITQNVTREALHFQNLAQTSQGDSTQRARLESLDSSNPSDIGQMSASPASPAAGKDISRPVMGRSFPKGLERELSLDTNNKKDIRLERLIQKTVKEMLNIYIPGKLSQEGSSGAQLQNDDEIKDILENMNTGTENSEPEDSDPDTSGYNSAYSATDTIEEHNLQNRMEA
jgi:deoxyuridine 5'-triphosphate nucleotidohydrolase